MKKTQPMDQARPNQSDNSAALWLGTMVNIVAVAGIIVSVLNDQPIIAGFFAAGLALFFGCWFWQIRRKLAMSLLMIGGLILMAAGGYLLTQRLAPASPAVEQPATPAATSPGVVLRLETEVTLPKGAAVDVDQAAEVQRGQAGTSGPLDLYFDVHGNLYASSDIYMYPTGLDPAVAHDKCREFMDHHAATIPFVPISKGAAWCYNTSEGRSSWAQVAAKTSTSVTLKVRVWEK